MHIVLDLTSGASYIYKIWTHGELLRFANPRSMAIAILEVKFAPRNHTRRTQLMQCPWLENECFDSVVWDGNSLDLYAGSCRLAYIGTEGMPPGYGVLGLQKFCYVVQSNSSMTASSHAQPVNKKFTSGRNHPLAIHSSKISQPVLYAPRHFFPWMVNQL